MAKKNRGAIYRGASFGSPFCLGGEIYKSNINSHTDFGVKSAYTISSGVNDRYTDLAGTVYFSPDEVEMFSEILFDAYFQDMMTVS